MFRSWSSLTVRPEVLKESLSLFTEKKGGSKGYKESNEIPGKRGKHENEENKVFVDNASGDGEMFVVALNARLPRSKMDVKMTGTSVYLVFMCICPYIHIYEMFTFRNLKLIHLVF